MTYNREYVIYINNEMIGPPYKSLKEAQEAASNSISSENSLVIKTVNDSNSSGDPIPSKEWNYDSKDGWVERC